MKIDPNNFISDLNDSDKWKIQRVYKERHVPALFGLENVAIDFLFLVLVLALVAILPGMKNKMVKRWIKIFICLAISAVLLCALIHKNWIVGGIDIPISYQVSNTELAPENVNQFIALRVSVGLGSLNVSAMTMARPNQPRFKLLVQDLLWMTGEDEMTNLSPAWIFNYELSLLGPPDTCSTEYLKGLTSGWPAVILDVSEFLADGYHSYYFAGPDISWCSVFRKAGYRAHRLLVCSVLVICLTWFLYVRSLVIEAAVGTFLLGVLMLASNLSYVTVIGAGMGDLRAFDYHATQVGIGYGNDGNGGHYLGLAPEIREGAETWRIHLRYGGSFWSVLGTGCICLIYGILLVTSFYLFPQYLRIAFDELTLHDIVLTLALPKFAAGSMDPMEEDTLVDKLYNNPKDTAYDSETSVSSDTSCERSGYVAISITSDGSYETFEKSLSLSDISSQSPKHELKETAGQGDGDTCYHYNTNLGSLSDDSKSSMASSPKNSLCSPSLNEVSRCHFQGNKRRGKNYLTFGCDKPDIPHIYLNDVLLLENALSQDSILLRQAQPHLGQGHKIRVTKGSERIENMGKKLDKKFLSPIKSKRKHSKNLPVTSDVQKSVQAPKNIKSNNDCENGFGSKVMSYFKTRHSTNLTNPGNIIIPNILLTRNE